MKLISVFAMDKIEYKDDIEYSDKETGDKLIFNTKTWISLIKGIINNYVHKSEYEANVIIEKSNLLIPKTYNQVIFYSHETEYHWAMLITYGEAYWLKGISSNEPIDYEEWEKRYRKISGLKKKSFEFIS
jgi:hypothetical protein